MTDRKDVILLLQTKTLVKEDAFEGKSDYYRMKYKNFEWQTTIATRNEFSVDVQCALFTFYCYIPLRYNSIWRRQIDNKERKYPFIFESLFLICYIQCKWLNSKGESF